MSTFEYILILLTAVFLSNLINRFIPAISVSIIQILLGAGIYFLPVTSNMELDTNLFFVLFIAPLIFNAGMLLDKKTFWLLRRHVLNMSVILVIVSIFVIGWFIQLLIPTITIGLAFILAAALSPTDDVAIISVSHKATIPHKLMNLLIGESIINDATGIVGFQLAFIAVVSGVFSVGYAVGQLFVVSIGGLLVGLAFTGVKYLVVRWMRRIGIENIMLHILLEILTPFIVFLLAEALGVSGILSVFTAGVVHSLSKRQLNPETANLNIVSKNIWSVFSFTLEGVVYLILGTQLPRILYTIQSSTGHITIGVLLFYILAITLSLVLLRYIWFCLTVSKKSFFTPDYPLKKWKSALIFSLSGARGAITMATVLSIPVLLNDGTAFPQRDLIILLASGVILLSLLITNFLLPLIAEKAKNKEQEETEIYIEMLQDVMATLKKSVTKENNIATAIILKQYQDRIKALQYKLDIPDDYVKYRERNIRMEAWKWEEENLTKMIDKGEVTPEVFNSYQNVLNKHFSNRRKRYIFIHNILRGIKLPRFNHRQDDCYKDFIKLKEANIKYVIEKLKELQQNDDCYELKKIISEYESLLMFAQSRNRQVSFENIRDSMSEVASLGFQIERNNIQTLFEEGRISREKSKELRNNIMLLEIEMK